MSFGGGGGGGDDARSPGSGGTPGPLSHQPASQQSNDNTSEAGVYSRPSDAISILELVFHWINSLKYM